MLESQQYDRRSFIGAMAAVVATSVPAGLLRASSLYPDTNVMSPSLQGASGWVNSAPIALSSLKGQVAVINFWTFSCINWRRSLPYVRAWNDKYRDHGLVIVGVHSPEFNFERSAGNVRQAVGEMRIDYPVALDNDYAVWRAFDNQYWPALYFVDANGRIRHHQFGEGEYEGSERVIQQLLSESGKNGYETSLSHIEAAGFELQADWSELRSPENYLGFEETENFSSPERAALDRRINYHAPKELELNHWALGGECSFGKQAIKLNETARILYRFHARDLHLVMGADNPTKSVLFRILLDGEAPGQNHGLDVDAVGNGTVSEPRMYQLVRQTGPITDRTLDIEFLEPGAEAYSFTFG